MTTDRTMEYLASLVNELRKLPKETEWVEFKVNDAEPQEIGEYLSALSNSAAFCGKAFAYLVWGWRTSPMIWLGPPSTPPQPRWVMKNWKTGCYACFRPASTFTSTPSRWRGRGWCCWRLARPSAIPLPPGNPQAVHGPGGSPQRVGRSDNSSHHLSQSR